MGTITSSLASNIFMGIAAGKIQSAEYANVPKVSKITKNGKTYSLKRNKGTGKSFSYKKLPVRDTLLKKVENGKLKNAINEIYRKGATIGDGGLADALRYEVKTGKLVGGKSHLTKAKERITNLENIIKKQKLSNSDLEIANKLLNDLKKAIRGL